MFSTVGQHEQIISELFDGETTFRGDRPVHDYPLVLMGFTNRCGSNIIAEYLRMTGNFGGLYEHLNHFAVKQMRESGVSTFPDHISSIVRMLASESHKTFGFKASWDQILMLLRWRIDKMFPSLHIIHVERMDVVAQAVSYTIANQTKKWTSEHGGNSADPVYSRKEIQERANSVCRGNQLIRQICAAFPLKVTNVTYEEVLESPILALERVHREIGVRLTSVDVTKSEFKRQSSGVNKEFIWRFRQEALADINRQDAPPAPSITQAS